MTTFILAPATPATVLRSPLEMLEAGELRAYSLRDNGTMRHLDLAPVGSTRRDTAEWISERLDEGITVKAVSRELHVSVPTIRRIIMSLELTEEIEAGEWDGIWDAPDSTTVDGPEMTEAEYALATTELPEAWAECTCAAGLLDNSWHTPGCLADSALV